MAKKLSPKSKLQMQTDKVKSKNELAKLKRKKKLIAGEQAETRKKLKKLKEIGAKKGKIRKVKELVSNLLKKEQKIKSRIKASKGGTKMVDKKKKAKSKAATRAEKGATGKDRKKRGQKLHSKTAKPMKVTQTGAQKSNQNREQDVALAGVRKSVDYLAIEAIERLRKIQDGRAVELFVLGDQRKTVHKAAQVWVRKLARK
jgi:carbamoylphosphate synthase small subunit